MRQVGREADLTAHVHGWPWLENGMKGTAEVPSTWSGVQGSDNLLRPRRAHCLSPHGGLREAAPEKLTATEEHTHHPAHPVLQHHWEPRSELCCPTAVDAMRQAWPLVTTQKAAHSGHDVPRVLRGQPFCGQEGGGCWQYRPASQEAAALLAVQAPRGYLGFQFSKS